MWNPSKSDSESDKVLKTNKYFDVKNCLWKKCLFDKFRNNYSMRRLDIENKLDYKNNLDYWKKKLHWKKLMFIIISCLS